MSEPTLTTSDLLAAWAGKLKDACSNPPLGGFDGRRELPAYLLASARDQAERVFLVLDATPLERRDLGEAERLIQEAGMGFLNAWGSAMETLGADREPWANDAANAAVQAYNNRLDELGPALHGEGSA